MDDKIKRSSQVKEQEIRSNTGGTVKVRLTRTKAIKAMCTECMGWGEGHPKDCTDKLCPLWHYRGKIQLAYGEEVNDEDEEGEE